MIMSRQSPVRKGIENPNYDPNEPTRSTTTFDRHPPPDYNEIIINENSSTNNNNIVSSNMTSNSASSIDRENLTKYPTATNEKPKGTSDLETLMHIIKANIGTGVLAMPLAFKNGGLVLSGVSLWIMAIICIHCMHLLLNCYKHVIAEIRKQDDDMAAKMCENTGYEDVVFLVAKCKCAPFSRKPRLFRVIVSIFLVIGQLGFCCVYIVFVPTNIKQVIDYYVPNSAFTVEVLMSIVLVPLMLFCMVKDLKILAPFSTFANGLMIFSMGFILFEIFFSDGFKPFSELEMVADFSTWPIYFSSAIYAFEGISLVMPVYHEMRHKSRFAPLSGVLNTAMAFVAIMYFSIGFFGYLKYGADSAASITLNLPSKSIVFQLIKIFFAIAIFITYNLQFYVAADILWSYLFDSSKWLQSMYKRENTEDLSPESSTSQQQPPNERRPLQQSKRDQKKKLCVGGGGFGWLTLIENLFRAALVLLTYALAINVPRIDLFISLVGSVASSTLALIIPPVLDFAVFYNGSNKTAFRFVKNILIILFGLYIFISGTYVSVYDIIKYLSNK